MRLTIANETGHTVMENMTVDDMLDQIQDHPTHWIYLDGIQVPKETITATDWDSVADVLLMPGMQGGGNQ